MSERHAIFISHASPEDNEFTIWLGAKLASAGYAVWADVLRLNGGDDWQRKLEVALRELSYKVLLVANEGSVKKQGVRNEIQIATDVSRKIGDTNFIIPLCLGPFEAPFLIAHAQYIDFSRSWAGGLHELMGLLEDEYKVPREHEAEIRPWISLRALHGKRLVSSPERLISNWLKVRRIPDKLFYYTEAELRSVGVELTSPAVAFREGWITAEDHHLEPPVSSDVSESLDAGWRELEIPYEQYRRIMTDLVNQAIDLYLESKGLREYEMAKRHKAWWFGADLPSTRIGFAWSQDKGSRQLQGISAKRKVHWHFGITASYRGGPIRHIGIKSRLIFAEDGLEPLASKPRMHRLRRSFAKGWRNARWRDLLLTFLFWLSGGETVVSIPMGPDQDVLVEFPTISYTSDMSIPEDSVPEVDMDDPDVGFVEEEEIEPEE